MLLNVVKSSAVGLTCARSPWSRLADEDPGEEHTGQQQQLRHQGLRSLSSIHTQPDRNQAILKARRPSYIPIITTTGIVLTPGDAAVLWCPFLFCILRSITMTVWSNDVEYNANALCVILCVKVHEELGPWTESLCFAVHVSVLWRV